MNVALAILAALLLSACAHKPPQTYGALDPCLIHDGTIYCAGSSTQAESDAWSAYHLAPSLDECEQEALDDLRLWNWADAGTTAVGIVGCGAIELNPLGPVGVVGAKVWHHRWIRQHAAGTSRYTSTCKAIDGSAKIVAGAAAWNIGVLSACL